jgi:Ulp1 family protease
LRPVIATPVSSVSHQKNDTECGVYSLFFIRKRIVGVPYTYFQDHVISDNEVKEFRKYIFRD